ncbi:putative protein N(5)-glutamine methyltransferase [Nocardioides sp.]|uniref:putative protein N(5)-glutamine methyltransferase n=1 Tax=Nocardioides sp. TaxID=35761 RepID=UPI00356434A7
MPRPPSHAAATARLRAAGCVFAEQEARVLLEAAGSPNELERMLGEREAGAPLEVVVGWADFGGQRILLDPGVFVPRRRTELLADRAADLAGPGAVVLDLCCGSGAVAAVVHARVPGATVWAADADPVAVGCARRNLPPDRVLAGDLYDALPAELLGRVDVLACNAPYVPTSALALMPAEARLHEPSSALDGGADGLDLHRRVVAGARRWLSPGGHLLVETSSAQSASTRELMAAAGLNAEIIDDVTLEGTVAIGRR